MDEAVIFFSRMGLAEHQTIYALHKNTGRYHLHIAVNRTHPTRRSHSAHRFDINEAHKIVMNTGRLELLNECLYRVNEQGYVVRSLNGGRVKPDRKRKTLRTPRAKNPRSVSRRSAAMPSSRAPHAGRSFTPDWMPLVCVSSARVPAR
ncbi:MAG: relaxase/mobilization nuclease domain-containing protein [Bilophila wadsworthia]